MLFVKTNCPLTYDRVEYIRFFLKIYFDITK